MLESQNKIVLPKDKFFFRKQSNIIMLSFHFHQYPTVIFDLIAKISTFMFTFYQNK